MPDVFRADHVGSLLRPPAVHHARREFREGRLSQEELRETENRAILMALARQQAAGVDVFTDGEFRRSGFQNDLIEAVHGFVDTDSPAVVRVWRGPGGEPVEQGTRQVVGSKLRPRRGLTENQVGFLLQHAPGPVKITVPSPSQYPAISFQPGVTDQFYPTRSDLLWEIAGFIKTEIATLVESGVQYIQIDAPRYSYYVDPQWRQHLRDLGEEPDRMFEEAIAADNMCLEGARRPGITVAMHICRGNNQSKWYAEGGYEAIAERLFGSLNVDRFLLEYDTERAGTFEPLRYIPDYKMVVLGLVSSKEPTLEPLERLLNRVDEASAYVPLENLAVSPQCGFASTAAGNLLSEEEQWRKLELVAEVARRVWST